MISMVFLCLFLGCSAQAFFLSEFFFTAPTLSGFHVLALFHALLWFLHTPDENSERSESDMVKVEIAQIYLGKTWAQIGSLNWRLCGRATPTGEKIADKKANQWACGAQIRTPFAPPSMFCGRGTPTNINITGKKAALWAWHAHKNNNH
ncbi:hypothetical protein [Rhodoferax mekongensis]|uniref:hypothetical protein n=1 Tax=Rhodoferax mekongensis TaxID=3068341 RepID=UPI0028BD8553|nr:hypothetical protein [Rhodoferax sp. TBRC 17199]MDT7517019.1 hypothetical protein [Rhodoferax sp. TBRC 17199]